MVPCECRVVHTPKRIVLTGGPGAGKTALLELIRQAYCKHVWILPEAASVVFGGGFPRDSDVSCRRAAQRAIFYVQRELEETASSHAPAVVLCDRGTLDGLAYWPGPLDDLWQAVGSDLMTELARYDSVIHLQTPRADDGYNNQNPLRTETPSSAAELDRRIQEAWQLHSARHIVPATHDFLDKCRAALAILREEIPECCRRHVLPAVGERATKGGGAT